MEVQSNRIAFSDWITGFSFFQGAAAVVRSGLSEAVSLTARRGLPAGQIGFNGICCDGPEIANIY
jgi:hypothetical protein